MRKLSSLCSQANRIVCRDASIHLHAVPRVSCAQLQLSRRDYSKDQPKNSGSFISNLINNITEELERNKQLQENRRELQEKLQELSKTTKSKEKFDAIEEQTQKSTKVVVVKLKEFKDYVDGLVANVQSSEAGREALKQARQAVDALENAAKSVGDTQAYKHVASTAKSVRDELDGLADVRMYSRPDQLKMRSDGFSTSSRIVEPNLEATDVELHRESKWYAGWKEFSESNAYYNKLLDWKMKYDESDNIFVRAVRGVTERVGHVFTASSDVSEVLTEITKVDPSFDKHEWLRFCEKEVIPNVLEAFIRGDLPILEDWCHELAYKQLERVIKEYKDIGYVTTDSRVLDISKLELVSGKMVDQGPVLVITFQAFMINVVRNKEGKVVEGDPKKPVRIQHIWVMCRDMSEYNPSQAWKLLELHMQQTDLSI